MDRASTFNLTLEGTLRQRPLGLWAIMSTGLPAGYQAIVLRIQRVGITGSRLASNLSIAGQSNAENASEGSGFHGWRVVLSVASRRIPCFPAWPAINFPKIQEVEGLALNARLQPVKRLFPLCISNESKPPGKAPTQIRVDSVNIANSLSHA